MTNRGFKRGLAVSATTALAITGLPFFAGAAHAATATADDMTLTAGSTSVPTGGSTTVTARVTNAGAPVSGAEVFWDANNDGTEGTGVEASQPTNNEGRASFAGIPAGTQVFIADLNDNGVYDNGVDIKRSIVIGTYAPAATNVTATSNDGSAFDFDEYDATDIRVRVTDQNGNPLAGQVVRYSYDIDPFAAGAPNTSTTEASAAPTDAQGYTNIPVVGTTPGTYTLNYYINRDGTPGEGAGDLSGTDLVFKAGQADIVFDNADPQQAVIGTDATVSGKLELEDGTGLPDRPIQLVASEGDNANFNQATGPDANTYDTKTDANGSFTSVLDDPDGDQGAETRKVVATTTAWVHGTPADTDNAVDSSTTHVSFQQNVSATYVNATQNDSTANSPDTAGELQDVTVEVRTAPDNPDTAAEEGAPLTNQTVTLTTDHGFFTDGTEKPVAVGGYTSGDYVSQGQSITVRTNGSGFATAQLSIARDAGFDDDGDVTATVTANAGSGSDSVDVFWTSEDPLNAGEVTVDFASASQQDSSALPEARTGDQRVGLVVKTFDQYGNRVGDEDVELSDNAGNWDFLDGDITTDYDEQADDAAYSNQEGTQNVTATWNYASTQYTPDNTNGGDVGTALDETTTNEQTDTIAIQWYDGNVSDATVTMDDNTGGQANVGETVTEKVTVLDQKGNPVQGYFVEFVRSGPNSQQGDVNYTTTTNSNGVATYNFKGDTAGTASISATVREVVFTGPFGSPEPGSQVATKNDTVKFGAPAPSRISINSRLIGHNNGGRRNDVLTVNGPNAAKGATVRLYRWKHGHRRLVATKVANRYGNAAFVIRDLNGRGYTKYRGYMGTSAKTRADWTNYKRVR